MVLSRRAEGNKAYFFTFLFMYLYLFIKQPHITSTVFTRAFTTDWGDASKETCQKSAAFLPHSFSCAAFTYVLCGFMLNT